MKRFIVALICLSTLLLMAQSWYPQGSKPLSQDLEKNSLHKINQLLYSSISNNAMSVVLTSGSVQVSNVVLSVTNYVTDSTITDTNFINADTTTPKVFGTSSQKFRSITLMGYKAPKTPNTDTVWIQFRSQNNTNGIPLVPEGIITISAPSDKQYSLNNVYLDVGTANDGIIAIYFN